MIQVLKPKYDVEACLREIRECLEIGWTGMGFKTVQFEDEWKRYTGHKYAFYLNSDTVGLHLAVKILKIQNGWQDGDEIITTPITFVSTNHAILYENLHPTFADVDEYLCLEPEDVERKINKKTRAVMFVGYGGRTGKLKDIIGICKKHNLKLILDAAHMTGTTVDGIWPGTWDGVDVAVYSYQAVKNLPTGDSGMICWANEYADKITRQMAWLGINKDTYSRQAKMDGSYVWKYDVDYIGYKYHGNAVMAAIALAQIKHLEEDNIRRREIVCKYEEAFKDCENIKSIPANYSNECSFHLYELIVPDREGLLKTLAANGINGGVHYRDNTEYSMYQYAHGSCPNAHKISHNLITLPLHMWLTNEDVEMIIDVVKNFVCK